MTSAASSNLDAFRRRTAGQVGADRVGRADEEHVDVAFVDGPQRARDDLRRRAVAAHRVDRDHGRHGKSRRYFTSRTWRPRYQPQFPHTRCGRRDAPQFGHSECAGGASRMFADLRERVAERLILRFGTAMFRSSS